jgi:hypothetical protein
VSRQSRNYRLGHHRWAIMPGRRRRLAYAGYDGHGVPIEDEHPLSREDASPAKEARYLEPGELEEIRAKLRED